MYVHTNNIISCPLSSYYYYYIIILILCKNNNYCTLNIMYVLYHPSPMSMSVL